MARYAAAMSGFPWTSLITAVVPAAAVLAGAALTGRQNSQAGRTAALKADYAGFVQAVTSLIEHRERVSRAGARFSPGADARETAGREAVARDIDAQLVSAVERARAVVDLAGSYGARRAPWWSPYKLISPATPALPALLRRRWRRSSGLSAARWAARAVLGSGGESG